MKKIKIRITAVLIAASLLLTGCGENEKPNENNDGAGTSKTSDNLAPVPDAGIRKDVPSDVEKGTVLTQSIEVGEFVSRNTEVELEVSSGEIPIVTSAINLALPVGLKGRFEFIYLEDGVITKREERDISITTARTVRYDLKGKVGQNRQFAIVVRSIATNKEAKYAEIEVDFSTDPPSQKEMYKDISVFVKLPM